MNDPTEKLRHALSLLDGDPLKSPAARQATETIRLIVGELDTSRREYEREDRLEGALALVGTEKVVADATHAFPPDSTAVGPAFVREPVTPPPRRPDAPLDLSGLKPQRFPRPDDE
jgi:hypothetical protein